MKKEKAKENVQDKAKNKDKAKEKDKKDLSLEQPSFETLVIDHVPYSTQLTRKYLNRPVYEELNPNLLAAFIPGTITDVLVTSGEQVIKGQDLVILEAMKMLNEIKAPNDAKVKAIHVSKGDKVSKNQLLIELE